MEQFGVIASQGRKMPFQGQIGLDTGLFMIRSD